MMKKLKIFALLSALALGITSCSANAAPLPYSQDDFDEATIDTPWVDYSVPATEISFADGQEHKILNKGETYQYVYTLSPSSASDVGVKWESSNVSVATVSKGVVTAHNAGTANISVRNIETDELFKTLAVTVNVPIEDFSLSEESITLKYNQNYQINVSALPEDTTELGFAYSSNNESIASVSDSGLVTTHEVDGEATISVTSPYLNKVASLTVKVGITHVESVSIAPVSEKTLEVNKTLQLSASVLPENAEIKDVSFESSNEEIASVTKDGLVTGLKDGNVNIYARSVEKPQEVYDLINLSIYEITATSVSIGEGTIELSNPGVPTYQLNAVYYNDLDVITPSKTNGQYSTSDASIANVSQNGLVTMFSKGEATITYIDTYAGIMAERTVICTANATSVVVSGSNKVAVNEEITLSAAVTPNIDALSHGDAVTFTQISGESFASFEIKDNTSITVKGLARGKASFIATYGQIHSNEFTVQVVEDRIIYLNTNNLLEEADAVLFAHYWNEEGLAGTVNFNKVVGQDIIYTAALDGEATSFMVVRCAAGAVDIIWNNPEADTGNVWGQSGNIIISDKHDMWTVTNYTEGMIYGSYEENFDPNKDYSPEEPQEVPTGFGLIINNVDVIKGEDQGEVDVYGTTYHQYFLDDVSFKKNDLVALFDLANASAWTVNIDSSSFDGKMAEYISYNSLTDTCYTVLQDFEADVYIKLRYEADVIYFGLISGGGEEPPAEDFEPYAIYGLGESFENVKLALNPENENEWYVKIELATDGLEVKFCLADKDADWRGYSHLKANLPVSVTQGDSDNIKFADAGIYEFFIAKAQSESGSIWIQKYDDSPVVPDQKIKIYYNNVNGWENVNAYAWNSKGDNGWPGEAMTLVEGKTSIYEVELSSSYVNIIFNDGTNQTEDLTIDKDHPYYNNGVWADYTDEPEPETIYQVKLGDGEFITLDEQTLPNNAPENQVAKYSINHDVIKDQEFNFYVDGTAIKSILANQDGDEVYNNYVLDVNTLYIQADAENALVELNVYTNSYSFWISGGTSADHTKVSAEKVTIYFNNLSGWADVYAYVWHDVIDNSWPGEKMTLVEGSVYKIEVSTSYTSIIFNNGNDAQTEDLTIDQTHTYYNDGNWTDYDPSVPEPLKVSESSLLLPQNSSATVSVSGGVGEISVNSNNKSVANVSISGNTITVTTGNVVNAATITVSDEGGNEVTFTVTIGYEFTISWDADTDWVYNDNAVIYAYAWTDGESNQAWYKTVKVSDTSLKVVLPVSNNRLVLGRFPNSIDVKDASFDNKWNQTSDIIFSQGTFAYTATWYQNQ